MPTSPTDSYRRDIDGLRSLAVLPVVLGHAKIAGFSGGFVGVDIFFVISGYLITGILLREIAGGEFSVFRFYERRARRILPALFALLLVCVVFGWFFFAPQIYEQFSKSAFATLLFVSNIWFWWSTGDYFSTGAGLEPLLHTWSLGVEEQFYIFFPLLLWALARRETTIQIWWVSALAAASFVASIVMTHLASQANFFLLPTRIWELGIGALLAMGILSRVRTFRVIVEGVAIIGVALIVGSIVFMSNHSPFPGLAALPPCLGAAAILWSGGQHSTYVSRILSHPVPVFFGLISYSLYLWHWPLLVVARLWSASLEPAMTQILLAIAVAVLMGWLSWRFVERPFRTPAHRGGMPARSIWWGSGLSGAVFAAVSVVIVWGDGAEIRVPAQDLAVVHDAKTRALVEKRCLNAGLGKGLCVFGQKGPPTALVWGDSHAAAMLPGFEDEFALHGVTGAAAVKVACPPLLGIVRLDQGPSHGCDIFNAEVMAHLRATPTIATVYLAARWALAAEGHRALGEDGRGAILARGTVQGENAQLFREGLFATVEALNELGVKTVLVEGVPEIGFSVPVAWMNERFSFLSGGGQTIELQKYNRRNQSAQRVFASLEAQFDLARKAVAPHLCTPVCQTEVAGHLLYRDDDHLSQHGARWLLPKIIGQ